MNQAIRRDEIIRTLETAANGSFWIVQRALAEVSKESRSSTLDLEAVRERIKRLLAEAETETQSDPSDEE